MFDTTPAASAAADCALAYTVGASCLAYTADLSRALRERATELRELLQRIESHLDEQHQHAKASADIDEMQRLTDADPYRWLADAKHSLQAGVMFAERAVMQPATF